VTGIDQPYVPALTGFRAVAAWLVVIYHYNPFPPGWLTGIPHRIVNEWHLGVSFFFVLSGFLITWKYYAPLTKINIGYFRTYMIRRSARIYPVYFILTTLTFIVYLFQDKHLNIDHTTLYFLNITFLKGFFDELKFSLISQGWSLTVEESFYLLAPFLFLLIRKNKFYLIILPVAFMLIGISLVKLSDGMSFYGFFSDTGFLFTYTFFGRCFEFFTGISLAIFLRSKTFGKRRGSWFTYVSIFCLVLTLIIITNTSLSHQAKLIVHQGLIPLLAGLFIAGLLLEGSGVKKILESKVLDWLGKSSYSLYLIHLGIIPSFIMLHITSHPILVILILLLISVILWHQVEEPLLRFILKQAKLKRAL
jgi:peptidoglycan/LPS O-acetylase OafA/YrhL